MRGATIMEKQIKKLENGTIYISCDFLSFGDHDNSCSVERANVKYLEEHADLKDSIDNSYSMGDWHKGYTYKYGGFYKESEWPVIDTKEKLVKTYGGYGSRQLWVREDIWNELELDSLENYPVIDDETLSMVEMEMENEVWDCCYKDDLIESLDNDNLNDFVNEMENDKLFDIYQQAMKIENEYPVFEAGGNCYIPVDRIKDTFKALIIAFKNETDENQ